MTKPWGKWMEDKVRRYRWERKFWLLNMPVTIALFILLPKFWATVSILYLNQVSIYALVITAGGAAEAAEAAKAVKE